MIDVAEKFSPQIETLAAKYGFAEENVPLQERLKKAADYFLTKLKEHLESPLENAGFETDNRAIRKRVADILGQLETELAAKRAGLESVTGGFSIQRYLEARALASIEKPAVKARKQASSLNVTYPDFYRKLLEWRMNKSLETGLDESKILRQKVMLEIAQKLPATAVELKATKGMGGKKMEQFGQEILALVLDFRRKKEMDIPLNAKQEVELAWLDTKEVSLVLFKQGLKPPQIAKKRNLAVSTIEGHLAHFVVRGKLDIFDLIDRKKYDIIVQHLRDKTDTETTSDIKNKLGDEYSYGEIKLVMADLYK
jgi:hypothetical protein